LPATVKFAPDAADYFVEVLTILCRDTVAATLQAYISVLDHVSEILVKIVKIPALEDREQRIAQEKFQMVATALRAAVADVRAGLTHKQARAVLAVFSEEIRKVQ